MYGISLDESHDRPVGTPEVRRTKAIHWHWTTEATCKDIADALGVNERTVKGYINSGPTEEVKEKMQEKEAEIRIVAIQELKAQLKAAGNRSRTAEKPVEIWEDNRGHIRVKDKHNPETGELVDRYPIPADYTLMPDEEARYYAREEVRDILDQLTTLVGAKEPEEHKVDHEGLQISVSDDVRTTWNTDSDGD